MAERLEAQRMIPAPSDAIFEVLRDPQVHVAIHASGVPRDADGEPVSAVDDTFVAHLDREGLNDFPMGKYQLTVGIREFNPAGISPVTSEPALRATLGILEHAATCAAEPLLVRQPMVDHTFASTYS